MGSFQSHLFPGLLNISQVKHPCLADAAFLEATGKLERGRASECGFPSPGTQGASCLGPGCGFHLQLLCGKLACLFCFIQYKPLFLCCVSQHSHTHVHTIYPDTKYTNTAHIHIYCAPNRSYPMHCKSHITLCVSDCYNNAA